MSLPSVPKYRLEVSNEAAVKEVEEAKGMIALFETMRLVLEAVPDEVMAVVEAKVIAPFPVKVRFVPEMAVDEAKGMTALFDTMRLVVEAVPETVRAVDDA